MSITLRQIQKAFVHGELVCVAGMEGLDSMVANLTVIDSPEILNWIKGGEFVVSTGYVTYTNPKLQNTLIKGLKEKGAVGLGIKLHRYYDEIPEKFVEEADKLGFPLFAISYETRMSDLMHLVYANFFSDSMDIVEKKNLLYKQVVESVLSEDAIDLAMYNIAQACHNPVFLVDKSFRVVALETHEDNEVLLSDYVNVEEGELAFNTSTIEYLLSYYRDVQFQFHRMNIGDGDRPISIVVIPLSSSTGLKGFFVVMETIRNIPKAEYSVLNVAANILKIYLLQREVDIENPRFSKNDFLNAVLLNVEASDKTVQQYCQTWNFDYSRDRVCIYFSIQDYRALDYYVRKKIDASFFEAFKAEAHKAKSMCFQYKQGYIGYYLFAEMPKSEILEEARDSVRNIVRKMSDNGIESRACISSVGKNIAHIRESFHQSIDGMQIGEKFFGERSIYLYRDILAYDLLMNDIPPEKLRALYENTVAALDDFDLGNNTNLLHTLEVYLECNCNATHAAQNLHMHRNTMMNQIEKIEGLLHSDIKDSDTIFNMRLGIRARNVLLITN